MLLSRAADVIFVMEHGRIVRTGTYQHLSGGSGGGESKSAPISVPTNGVSIAVSSGGAGVAASPAPVSFHELLAPSTVMPAMPAVDSLAANKRQRFSSTGSGAAEAAAAAGGAGLNSAPAPIAVDEDGVAGAAGGADLSIAADEKQTTPARAQPTLVSGAAGYGSDSKRQPLIDDHSVCVLFDPRVLEVSCTDSPLCDGLCSAYAFKLDWSNQPIRLAWVQVVVVTPWRVSHRTINRTNIVGLKCLGLSTIHMWR